MVGVVSELSHRRRMGGRFYLTGKLEDATPFVVRETGFLFQRVGVGNRPVLAERENQQVVKPLGVWGPLSQNDPSACPRSLTQVMGILFLGRTMQ